MTGRKRVDSRSWTGVGSIPVGRSGRLVVARVRETVSSERTEYYGSVKVSD